MNHPVVSSLLPVVFLIALGFVAGRRGWLGRSAAKDLGTLAFNILTPALLFRTMSTVHLEQVSLKPVASYFIAAGVIFFVTLLVRGINRRAAVLGLAATYSNAFMIGLPLVSLAYGPEGTVTQVTLIALHALIMLTTATIALEIASLHEAQAGASLQRLGRTVLMAVRNSLLHPVPLPILVGLAFAQTGWVLPPVIDRPLQMLGGAFAPLALVMVGLTLAHTAIGEQWKAALALVGLKNFVHPVLTLAAGLWLGVGGLPLTVMVVAASLPAGANVFLFSQRYQVAEELVTATVALSTLVALVSVTLAMLVMG